jgi:hypothetical protein
MARDCPFESVGLVFFRRLSLTLPVGRCTSRPIQITQFEKLPIPPTIPSTTPSIRSRNLPPLRPTIRRRVYVQTIRRSVAHFIGGGRSTSTIVVASKRDSRRGGEVRGIIYRGTQAIHFVPLRLLAAAAAAEFPSADDDDTAAGGTASPSERLLSHASSSSCHDALRPRHATTSLRPNQSLLHLARRRRVLHRRRRRRVLHRRRRRRRRGMMGEPSLRHPQRRRSGDVDYCDGE